MKNRRGAHFGTTAD